MNEIVELGNRLLDLFQGFGIVAVIIFAIGFVVWCVMAGFILKIIKGIFNRINESRERDPYESLFGKGYKERRNKGFEPKDIDMSQYIPGFQARVQLKRSCFCCEKTLKAGFWDGVKVIGKTLCPPKGGHYSVIYEDGSIYNGWI